VPLPVLLAFMGRSFPKRAIGAQDAVKSYESEVLQE
jgi:hypothetical protein